MIFGGNKNVAGLMTKSHPKSVIMNFDDGSPVANEIMGNECPSVNGKAVIVLQVMLASNASFVCEYIKKEDYEHSL